MDQHPKHSYNEKDLYQALEKNQFILYYQPIYRFDKQIVAVEALIRWLHPQYGLIAPMDFLPLCEACNLMIPLGEWVMRTACQQIKIWQSRYYPNLHLMVNLSAHQFHPELLDLVIDILDNMGFPPSCLAFEITETLLRENPETISPWLNTLDRLGVQLSLDDFGLESSSTSQLSPFPLTSIKIDRTLVAKITESADDAAFVQSMIAIGKRLNLKIIAEGVETQDQFDFLKANHCDYIQGFLLSKPVSIDDLEQLLIKQLS